MSKDPKNRQMSDRQWAKYLAKRNSESTSDLSDQIEATPDQVHDLELDSALRGLANIKNDTDFVDDVMEKVANSNPALSAKSKARKSLPTIDPVFENSSEQEEPAVPEIALASSAGRTPNSNSDLEEVYGPVSKRTIALAIAGCLVVTAIGAYCLTPSHPDAQVQTVKSDTPTAPEEILVLTEDPIEAPDSEGLFSKKMPESIKPLAELSSAAPIKKEKDPQERDLISTDEPSNTPPSVAHEQKSPNSIALPDGLASNDQPAAGDNPAAHESPAKAPSILRSLNTWDLVLNLSDEGEGRLTINNKLVSDEALVIHSKDLIRGVGSEASKRLAFLQPQIGSQIGGSVTIWNKRYDFEDPAEIEQTIEDALVQLDSNHRLKNRLKVLRTKKKRERNQARKKEEKARRAAYQAMRIAAQARINEIRTELEAVADGGSGVRALPKPNSIKNVRKAARSKEIKVMALSTEQRAKHRKIRESLFASRRYSPSTDELAVFENAEIHTENFLRGLAKEKLALDEQIERGEISQDEVAIRDQSRAALATENHISEGDFRDFALSNNELTLPAEEQGFTAKPLIQHLSSVQLKQQLRSNTLSYDLFEDLNAFRSAMKFVDTNHKARRSQPPQDLSELFEPLEDILTERPDLKGLPLVLGDGCRLDEDTAAVQTEVSKLMGTILAVFDSFGTRDIENDVSERTLSVRSAIENITSQTNFGKHDHALVTLDQMMQIDHPRLVLDVIEKLSETNTNTAVELLAKRAKFDLRPEVRFSATEALKKFPKEQYRSVLLEGFKYPWHVVAQHSAEALVRLDDKQAVPELVELLKHHKSLTSFEEDGEFFQKEVVAINHLRNCLLCHAPSESRRDPSRGQVPNWELPLSRQYYHSSSGVFVRADVTYLTQDFSVLQPVDNPGHWPVEQRYDYMVYKRAKPQKASQRRNKMKLKNVYKQAIVFALQSLTGEKPESNSWESWSQITEDTK